MRTSDDLLMRRAAGGDEGAFEELARKYRTLGIAHCQRILRDYQAAEDVYQEGLVHLYIGLGRYEEKGRFRNYFLRILSNLSIDHIRRRSKIQPNRERCSEVQLGGLEDEFPDRFVEAPAVQLVRKEKAAAVRAMISRLPSNQRRAIELRELKGYKYTEISRLTGFHLNRVKVLIFRGRRNLMRMALGS